MRITPYLTYLKEKYKKYKKLERSRKVSIVFFVFFLVFAQVVGICSSIAILDTIKIISSTVIPEGYVYVNFGTEGYGFMEAQVPYYIRNDGFYSLEQLELDIRLKVRYVDISTRENITLNFFYKEENLGDCQPLSELYGIFGGNATYFNITAVNIFINNADPDEFYWILGDIELKAKYFFGLIKYEVLLQNIVLY